MNISLFDDQKHGLNLLRGSIKAGNRRIVYAANVSHGKTVIMGYLTSRYIKTICKWTDKPYRVWIVVDSIELVNQTRDKLKRMFGIDSAVVQGFHEDTDWSKQVQVVMAQSLNNRFAILDKHSHWMPDFLMVDEAHIMHKSYLKLMNMMHKNSLTISFTATPLSKGMADYYTDMVVPSTVGQLINSKRLSKLKYFSCANISADALKALKHSGGDFTADSSAKVLDKALHGELIPNWKKITEGKRKTLVYCSTIKQSIEVQQEFIQAGIPCYQTDGFTDKDIRRDQLEEFASNEDGTVNVMTSVMALVKGLDITDIACICFYRITRSQKMWQQSLGRAVRKSDIYEDAYILDYGSNIQRLGFIEDYNPQDHGLIGSKDENKDTQDDGNQKEREAQICPKCKYIKPVGVNKCPECNFEPAPQRGELTTDDVEVVAGEMKEVKRTPAEKRNKETPNQDKQAFYSGLLRYARNKGYKDGWAKNKYKTRFSVWPNKYDSTPSDTIPQEVTSFITSENIRWAKRR